MCKILCILTGFQSIFIEKYSMKKTFIFCGIAIISAVLGYGQAAAPATRPQAAHAASTAPAQTSAAAAERALLDKYCVTCHNDKTKRANLTLEKLDLATVSDHPE